MENQYFALTAILYRVKWLEEQVGEFLTAQMSVLMVFCGPHFPVVANKLEGKWKVSLCLVAPPQVAAEYGINSSFC